MSETQSVLQLVVLLLSLVLTLGAFARRLAIPYPIVLVLGGLALSFVPGLPEAPLGPDLIFTIFLPPVLWAGAFESDLRQLRRSAISIAALAVGLVVVTTLAVAWVAHLTLPGISWSSAFILGAVVSSTDAVAATAVFRRLGIPRRLIALLEGESLLNDASALVLYTAAITARVSGEFSIPTALGDFVYDALGGITVGIAVAYVLHLVARLTRDAVSNVALTVLAAYTSWILGEKVGASAVLACVACGLTMRRHYLTSGSSAARVQCAEVWRLFVFLLNGVIFVLLGLEWPQLAIDLPPGGLRSIALATAAVCATVVLVRLAWLPLMTYGARFVMPARRKAPLPPRGWMLLAGWTGMRGIVTLAAALAVPTLSLTGEALPYRGRIVIISFAVILVTLVLQGLTLAPLIRRLGLKDDGEGARELIVARRAALDASVVRLDAIRQAGHSDAALVDMNRAFYSARLDRARSLDGVDPEVAHASREALADQRSELIQAQRQAVIDLWRTGTITDQTLADAEREIDLEELMFDSRRDSAR
jgi:CPA1 family monovalent cation:H+ antiporter